MSDGGVASKVLPWTRVVWVVTLVAAVVAGYYGLREFTLADPDGSGFRFARMLQG